MYFTPYFSTILCATLLLSLPATMAEEAGTSPLIPTSDNVPLFEEERETVPDPITPTDSSTAPQTDAAKSPPPLEEEVAELRGQIKALTETVAELQKQLLAQVDAQNKEIPSLFPEPDEFVGPPSPDDTAPEPDLFDGGDSLPPPPPELLGDTGGAADEPGEPALFDEPGQPELFTDFDAPSDYDESLSLLPESATTDLSIFNPEISLGLDFVGAYSRRADNFNFIGRNVEMMLQSNVDHLARAYVVLNAESELEPWEKSDVFGETEVGLEEAAIETTALPYGLVARAGQFFADFSRLGKIHSHDLPFIDRPSSLDEIIGGEAVSRGVEINWVPPVKHYFRITAGAVDNIGAERSITQSLALLDDDETDLFAQTDHRGLDSVMYYGRVATGFEFTDQLSLNVGTNYASGRERGRRSVAGVDFKLTWIPDPSSYDSLIFGGEYLAGRSSGDFTPDAAFAGGPLSGSSNADGGYLYLQYNRGKNWEATLRYDWLHPTIWEQTDSTGMGIADGIEADRITQNTTSAYLGYKFSEFNHMRLGVSYLDGIGWSYGKKDNDWLGFIQWTVLIGPHKHTYQP